MNARKPLSMVAPSSCSNDWATRLVLHAAQRLPSDLSERFGEEWLAHLAEQSSGMSRLRFALGCCWAGQVIGQESIVLAARVQRVAPASASVATLHPRDDLFLSRRAMVLLLIVALHGLVIYGFATGLSHTVFEALPPSFKAVLIEEPLPLDSPVPITAPDLRAPSGLTVVNTPPLTPIGPITITEDPVMGIATTPDPRPIVRTTPPHMVARVFGGPGAGFPSTADFYPALSRQLNEMGVAAVQVCVDSHGRLTSAPTIQDFSGSARLDAAALALAKAGSGHYRSTTEDGQPVASCYAFKVRFELK